MPNNMSAKGGSAVGRKKYFTHFLVSILVTVGIVIVINVIAFELFHRFDFTQDKNYSLSSTSQNILKGLSEKVTINVYFSEKLPPEYLIVRQNVRDLLSEYQTYGSGNIKINYIDPKDDEDLKKELTVKGIPELQFNVLEKDQFQLTNGYLGIAIDYLDKEEVLPVIENTDSFEYDLTSAIKKVASADTLKIAWAQNKSQKYSAVIKELKKDYEISEVDLSTGTLLDNAVFKSLVVAGVEEELDDKSRYVIDQFIMKGGSALFLLDSVKVDKNMQVAVNKTGLEDMLGNYGVTMKKNFVLDTSNEMASFQGGYMAFTVAYPYWVKISKDGFAKDNAAVSQLESLVLPWAAPLETQNGKPLVQSSQKSWLSPESINLDPQQDFKADNYSQYTLGVIIDGTLNSFYKDKDKPQEADTAGFVDNLDKARIVVIGDSDFVSDTFIGQYPSNFVFLANVLDWLNQDESLIAIRSKGISDRSLKELSDSEKATIKYLNIFGLTALVVILGAIRFILRKKKLTKIKFKL